MSIESGGFWGSDSADERPEWDTEELEHYEEMMPTKEQEWHNELKIGEYVRNISKTSKYYGKVGQIIKKDFSIHVKYHGEPVRGRHPAKILIREKVHFEDDLFTMK